MACREKVDSCVYNEKDTSSFVSSFETVGRWKLIKIGHGIDACLQNYPPAADSTASII